MTRYSRAVSAFIVSILFTFIIGCGSEPQGSGGSGGEVATTTTITETMSTTSTSSTMTMTSPPTPVSFSTDCSINAEFGPYHPADKETTTLGAYLDEKGAWGPRCYQLPAGKKLRVKRVSYFLSHISSVCVPQDHDVVVAGIDALPNAGTVMATAAWIGPVSVADVGTDLTVTVDVPDVEISTKIVCAGPRYTYLSAMKRLCVAICTANADDFELVDHDLWADADPQTGKPACSEDGMTCSLESVAYSPDAETAAQYHQELWKTPITIEGELIDL